MTAPCPVLQTRCVRPGATGLVSDPMSGLVSDLMSGLVSDLGLQVAQPRQLYAATFHFEPILT